MGISSNGNSGSPNVPAATNAPIIPSVASGDDGADEPPSSSGQLPLHSSLIPNQLNNPLQPQLLPSSTNSGQQPQSPQESLDTKNDALMSPVDLEANPTNNIGTSPKRIRFRLPLALPRLSKRSRLRALFTPTRNVAPPPGHLRSAINIVKYSPLNVLLAFIPVAWAMHWTHQSDTVVFITSALAIIPLAALLGFGTEQIAIRTSSALAGFLNATLGNLVELLIAGIALQHCELALVQSSLLGGLLSNLLLVLGMSFIVGGLRHPEQSFRPMAAQLNASLLTVGVISLMVPTAFHTLLGNYFPDATTEGPILLKLSRGSAIILIIMYCGYLTFQFLTHTHLFLDSGSDSDSSSSRKASWGNSTASSHSSRSSTSSRSRRSSRITPTTITAYSDKEKEMGLVSRPLAPPSEVADVHHGLTPVTTMDSMTSVTTEDEWHYPKVNIPMAMVLLVSVTVLLYFTAESLVKALEHMTTSRPDAISKEFLSLIVLPILSNAAEHSTAVVVAYKGKFDLVLGVAVGSCIQISLFVIPLLVLVAWGMDKPLSLLFDPLETACLFMSVLLTKFVIEDGKTHWMSGITLISVYILISVTFWFFPTSLMGVLGGNHSLFACVR